MCQAVYENLTRVHLAHKSLDIILVYYISGAKFNPNLKYHTNLSRTDSRHLERKAVFERPIRWLE